MLWMDCMHILSLSELVFETFLFAHATAPRLTLYILRHACENFRLRLC